MGRSRSSERMQRSASPPSRRRRRSPSPRRRHSRSPRRRSSPDYRPYQPERTSRDSRQQRGDGTRSGRGRQRDNQEDYISDDDIKAESYQEFRRLKRIKMMERKYRCIWRNTPSPPPGVRVEDEASKERGLHNGGASEPAPSSEPSADSPKHTEDPRLSEQIDGMQLEAPVVPDKDARTANTAKEQNGGSLEPDAHEPEEDEVLQELRAKEVALFRQWMEDQRRRAEEEAAARLAAEEEAKVVGPVPLQPGDVGFKADYGTHLRPGEGTAMAAFVQSGERIPRRGEVGLDATEIEKFERAGYVMSGSRHARMNAVRIRKENQVYTAEEKAALAMFNFEENKRKEARVLEEMKRLVDGTLGAAGSGKNGGE